jgi:hypothetical protein
LRLRVICGRGEGGGVRGPRGRGIATGAVYTAPLIVSIEICVVNIFFQHLQPFCPKCNADYILGQSGGEFLLRTR